MVEKDKNRELLQKNLTLITDNIKRAVYSKAQKGLISFFAAEDYVAFATSWIPIISETYDEIKGGNFAQYVTWIAMKRINDDLKNNFGWRNSDAKEAISIDMIGPSSKDKVDKKFNGFNEVEWEDMKSFIAKRANQNFKNKIVVKVITDYMLPKCENDDITMKEFGDKIGISECYVSTIAASKEVKDFFKVLMPRLGYNIKG